MSERVESLLSQLTSDEKCDLLAGSDMWHTTAVPRLGIPRLKMSDGPNGARGESFSGDTTSACFPCGTALAATWNPELIEAVGAALGEELRFKGAQVLLAPTVNIHRSPLAGRNFECYSEDPHLSARAASAFVRGVQSRGVGTCVKHFVCNDSEFERQSISSEVDERTLREIYLPPFEAAVCEAESWAIMSAYNRLNGTYCAEHAGILIDLLRGEWGFQGPVISDWFGTQSTAAGVASGLDLEMPGPARWRGPRLREAVSAGKVEEKALDDRVRCVLGLLERAGLLPEEGDVSWITTEPPPEQAIDLPEHRAIARQAARESIVLLKNDAALPLDESALSQIAVIGPNAAATVIQGGGSARVAPHYSVSVLDGITRRAGAGVRIVHERGCSNHKNVPLLSRSLLEGGESGGRLAIEFHNGLRFEGDPVLTQDAGNAELIWFGRFADQVDPKNFSARIRGSFVPPESGRYEFSLTSAGRSRLLIDGEEICDCWTQQEPGDSFFGAGCAEVRGASELKAGKRYALCVEFSRDGRRPIAGLRIGCALPDPDDLIERAATAAQASDAAVVVVGLTHEWECEGRDRESMDLPGRQNELVERVAAVNSRTIVVLNAGSPVSTPWLGRVAALFQLWYPGQEGGNALADLLFGDASPSGRLTTTIPRCHEDHPAISNYPGSNGKVAYQEGVFVGYRHYDAKGIDPLFAFGHGLGYTKFEYGALRVTEEADGEVLAELDITNVGKCRAHEVVQLYLAPPKGAIEQPEKSLRGIAKLDLAATETGIARFRLTSRDFASYDSQARSWVVAAGDYQLLAGSSCAEIRSRGRVTREAARVS